MFLFVNSVYLGCNYVSVSVHFLATSMLKFWAQMFTAVLFYAYVGIHQVRILVFDNYQTCLVNFTTFIASNHTSGARTILKPQS